VTTEPLPSGTLSADDLPRSVTIAFRVLEAVAASPGSGVSSLARSLDIAKSTVQRTLRTLEALDYVQSSGEVTRWSLTLRAYRLGSQAPAMDLGPLALPEMKQLSTVTNESIQLTSLDGNFVVVIEKIDGVQAVRSFIDLGARMPSHVSAGGKAMLSTAPHLVDDLLQNPLERFTDLTIVDAAAFRKEMTATFQRGFSINRGEYRPDVVAIGAAIMGPGGKAVGALSVSAPKDRSPAQRLKEMAPELMAAADRVSSSLGAEPRKRTG
jgi:IclR family acetate operon transcriptional repressor